MPLFALANEKKPKSRSTANRTTKNSENVAKLNLLKQCMDVVASLDEQNYFGVCNRANIVLPRVADETDGRRSFCI